MLKLNKPIKITEQEWPEGTIPVITVFNWVYNHKDFIRASIESILAQKTNFPIEIIIHDDASNDGTKEIILEYQTRYPQLFNNILQTENQWSKGKSVMTPLFEKPKGKYLALSHGDDYWTDSLKLQKQVDFLEGNEIYSGVVGQTEFSNNKNLHPCFEQSQVFCLKDAISHWFCHINTLTFRNNLINYDHMLKTSPAGDMNLLILLTEKGPIMYFPEIYSVYRIHERGVSVEANRNKKAILDYRMNYLIHFNKVFNFKYSHLFKRQLIYDVSAYLEEEKKDITKIQEFNLKILLLKLELPRGFKNRVVFLLMKFSPTIYTSYELIKRIFIK